jgi:hypothetical protein
MILLVIFRFRRGSIQQQQHLYEWLFFLFGGGASFVFVSRAKLFVQFLDLLSDEILGCCIAQLPLDQGRLPVEGPFVATRTGIFCIIIIIIKGM